jgi:subfamily B ATP-binding cassette protein HlyB/CyaB
VNLAFRYSEHHPWLYRNLNLRFKPGHLTVLMGPSGCGKSTLAKLLLGFYQPSEGQINSMEGHPPPRRQRTASHLRRRAAGDRALLRHLYDNLVMAHPHASFEDVIEACKAAEIHEVIEKLPRGIRRRSASGGPGSRAASGSDWPLPGRCSRNRRS